MAVVVVLMGMSGTFGAAPAIAADDKLASAHDALTKGDALLQAADCPDCAGQSAREFRRHVERARVYIERAQAEILAAIETANDSTP